MIHPNLTPEQIRKKQEEEQRKNKIAQSQASATPIQPRGPMAGPAVSRQQSPLMQIGQMLGKQALGSALGPLGGLLGGLFNVGGKVDYAKEAQKRVQAQNAAIKAGAQGQRVAPATRTLFNEAGKQIGEVPGDVIKGYGNRAPQQAAPQQDPFAGIAAKIAADKAAGKPVDYNALAALQHARSQKNTEARNEAMRAFMKRYPQFAKPGGSQGVVLRKNVGGPISSNPYGYNEGGPAQATPIKKVMDVEKLESQKKMDALKEDQAERAFQMGEQRKEEAHQQAMAQKEEAHAQAMKLKKESATMKAPLSKGG